MYQVMELPYSTDFLEPVLSQDTVESHYEIYKNYVRKFNGWLKEKNIHKKEPLENLLKNYENYPISDRGNLVYYAGAILNHQLYFLNMNPGGSHEPVGSVAEAILKQYGSYTQFMEALKLEASHLVGSGYLFLVLDSNQKLLIMVTTNQESPYLYGMIPIMVMDLWEHSYYLDYRYHRDTYIDAFFRVIDFDEINKRYEKAISAE